MALFYFILKVGQDSFPDPEGEEFDDLKGAKKHAEVVAGELMRNREAATAHWRVQVCDDYLIPCYECLFAEVNEKLAGYEEELRRAVIRSARTVAAMNDAMRQIGLSMLDLKQTVRLLDAATARFTHPDFGR
jgi:hypothetical protein